MLGWWPSSSTTNRNEWTFINFLCRTSQSNGICLVCYLWSASEQLFVTHSPSPLGANRVDLESGTRREPESKEKSFEWENNKKINTQQRQTSIWRNVKTFSITCVFNWDFPFDFACFSLAVCSELLFINLEGENWTENNSTIMLENDDVTGSVRGWRRANPGKFRERFDLKAAVKDKSTRSRPHRRKLKTFQ